MLVTGENRVKFKGKKLVLLVSLLVVITITLGVLAGCAGGITPVGWSGGAVANGFLYIGSNQGRLTSINLSDNSILRAEPFRIQAQGGLLGCSLGCNSGPTSVPIYGTPVISGDTVYVAGYNGQIAAYRSDNLAQRWIYPSGTTYLQPFVGGAVVFDNKLFIGGSDDSVYALDTQTGALLKKFKTGDRIWGTPTVDAASKTLFIGSYDKKLYALNTDDLTLKWSYTTTGSIISTPLVNNGLVYFGSFDKNLYAVKITDGTLAWKFSGGNWFWAKPEILNGVLYAACLDHFVYALDPTTGAAVHDAYDLKSAVASAPAIVDNLIVFASRDGVIYKIDSTTQEISVVIELNIEVDGPLTAHDGIVYIHPQGILLERVNPVTGAQLPAISLQS